MSIIICKHLLSELLSPHSCTMTMTAIQAWQVVFHQELCKLWGVIVTGFMFLLAVLFCLSCCSLCSSFPPPLLPLYFPSGHFCSPPPLADGAHLPCVYWQSTNYMYPPWTSLQCQSVLPVLVISCVYSCSVRVSWLFFVCFFDCVFYVLVQVTQCASVNLAPVLPLVLVIFDSDLFVLPRFLFSPSVVTWLGFFFFAFF